jgi:hypothetical protein
MMYSLHRSTKLISRTKAPGEQNGATARNVAATHSTSKNHKVKTDIEKYVSLDIVW